MHAINENCIQQGSCKKVYENFRRCYIDNFRTWLGCPYDIVFSCPTATPTPTPTPSPSPSPTPTPIPCPFTTAENCPNGVPQDPCTHNAGVPLELQTNCPILYVPTLDGLCCVKQCLSQPSPPQCPGGTPEWLPAPTCIWKCPEVTDPDPDPPDPDFGDDPCLTDPYCCGDVCCQDPCCSDPSCGQQCFEFCYVSCEDYCGVYDIYGEECIYWQSDCDYFCDVYCY